MKHSRLSRHWEKRTRRQIAVFSLATAFLLIALMIFGFPFLINLSLFIGGMKTVAPPEAGKSKLNAPLIEPVIEATNSADFVLTGLANESEVIEIFQNEIPVGEKKAGSDGSVIFDKLTLEKGENIFYLQAGDANGAKSEKSKAVKVYYSQEKPKLEIVEPKDKVEVKGGDGNLTIIGKTEAENSLTVNDRYVIVGADGQFNYNYPLQNGENKLKIKAKNKYGSSSEVELILRYSQ